VVALPLGAELSRLAFARAALSHPSPLVRAALRACLLDHRMIVVAEADDNEALAALVVAERPAVVVVASAIDPVQVESLLGRLAGTGAGVVVLSDDASTGWSTRLLAAGASGFLTGEASPGQVADAVAAVAHGLAAIEPATAAAVLEQWRRGRADAPPPATAELTRREREVLVALGDGLSAQAVALRLDVAVKTVEHHKAQLFRKLGARNQAQAVSLAIASGLLEKTGIPVIG
jgi:DNA-binding NarL/FixJ family response regulator